MPEHRVQVEQGWQGIAAALLGASPGDTVTLERGCYTGAETLWLGAGVTLAGEPGAMLECGGASAAIAAADAEGVVIRQLEVSDVAAAAISSNAEDASPSQSVPLLSLERVANARIDRCRISAGSHRQSGIALVLCSDAAVTGCDISGALLGLAFWGSDGAIRDCECQGASLNGIRIDEHDDVASTAEVRGNHCHGNEGDGIVIASAVAFVIEDNECHDNCCGVKVEKITDRVERGLLPRNIFANRCYRSRNSGINLFSSRTDKVAGNECWDNRQYGIVLTSSLSAGIEDNNCWANANGIALARDPESKDAPSEAPIRGNRCHGNAGGAGIVLFSSLSTGIENNECWGNANGIALQRDPESNDAPSEAPIRGNRCHGNAEGDGIVLYSSLSAGIEDNECWGNINGIALVRDAENKDTPSEAPIRGNRCHGNVEGAGIALFSSLSAGIEDNECWGNANGIALQRDAESKDAPSEAPIRGNRCHANAEGAGIVLYSSLSAGIEDNECWGNANGIALQRDADSKDAPSEAPIHGNRCHGNAEGAGIALFSSLSAGIEGNDCWANGISGIALQRDPDSKDAPSEAAIRGNRCHDNAKGDGIVLFSSLSAGIESNECWGNGRDGIAIERDSNTSEPSRAIVRSNRCYRHRGGAGIAVRGGMAELAVNACFGNAADYHPPSLAAGAAPLLGRGVPSPLERALSACAHADTAEALAGFLRGGCVACFRRFMALAPAASAAPPPPDGDDPIRIYEIVQAEQAERLVTARPLAGAERASDAMIAAMAPLAATGLTAAGHATCVLVSCDEDDPATVAERLGAIRAAAADRHADLPTRSPDRPLARALRAARRRLGPVIVVPLVAREPTGGGNLAGLIERALLDRTTPWRQRVIAVVSDPVILTIIVAAVVSWLLFPGITGRFVADTLADVTDPTKGVVIRIGAAAARLLAIAGLFELITRPAMPPSLRTNFGLARWRRWWSARLADEAVADAPEPSPSHPGRGWWALVRRRLLQRRRLVTLWLQGVDGWRAGDLALLDDLRKAAGKRMGCRLMLVLQTDERTLVKPLVLDGLARSPWHDGLTLVLADDADSLSLRSAPETPLSEDAASRLVGGTERLRLLAGAVRNDIFSALDLLPALSIGSAPAARFVIKRAESPGDSGQWIEDVGKELSGFDLIFDGRRAAAFTEVNVGQFEDSVDASCLAKRLVPLGMFEEHRPTVRVIGRVGRRHDAVQLVRFLHRDRDEMAVVDYIAQAGACGYLHLLRALTILIPEAGRSPVAVGRVRRGFEALHYLGREIVWASLTDAGGGLVGAAWSEVEAAMADLAAPHAASASAEVYAAFLTARLRHDPVRGEALLEPIIAAWAGERAASATAADALVEALRAQSARIGLLDPDRARIATRRWLRRAWPSAPAPVVCRFEAIASRGRSLPEMLASAGTVEEVELLVELHLDRPGRLAYFLGALSGAKDEAGAAGLAEAAANLLLLLRGEANHIGESAVKPSPQERDAIALGRIRGSCVPAFILSAGSRSGMDLLLAHTRLASDPLDLERITDIELDRTVALADRLVGMAQRRDAFDLQQNASAMTQHY